MYINEGFLYINIDTDSASTTEPFIKGRIVDMNKTLVCPGEIVPSLINPDTDPETSDISSLYNDIKYYTPLLKGIRIRIYWYDKVWHISTIDEIYPVINNLNVKFDMLDENKVYYAVIDNSPEDPDHKHRWNCHELCPDHKRNCPDHKRNCPDHKRNCTLLYTTEKSAPVLTLPHLDLEQADIAAFTNHQQLLLLTTTEINELQSKEKYGIVLFKEDGTHIEIWNKNYYFIKSMEKPNKVSLYIYYFQCLNQYDINETDDFELVMIKLLYDINEFIYFYPEHTAKCNEITKKIEKYISPSHLTSDEEKIIRLKYLLALDIEDAITTISPMPSRRVSFV